jgi:hypothetical protein
LQYFSQKIIKTPILPLKLTAAKRRRKLALRINSSSSRHIQSYEPIEKNIPKNLVKLGQRLNSANSDWRLLNGQKGKIT